MILNDIVMYCLEFGLKPKSGKEIMKYRKNMLALLIAGSLLTACGGSGSDISGGSSSSGNSSSGDSSSSGGSTVTAGAPANIVASALTTKFIAIQGYSSVQTVTAPVIFTVYDANGVAVPNQTVNFQFSNSNLSNLGYKLSAESATTNSSGQVTVNVTSGVKPRTVTVVASLASDPSIRTLSSSIATGTALAASNSITVSMDKTSLNADRDGNTATVTVRMTDRFNNPVPDNTPVYLTTTLGMISGSSTATGPSGFCVTANSACTATLTTQGVSTSGVRYGKGYVIAYTDGEEGFTDSNDNGLLDYDEAYGTSGAASFFDVSEPHIGSIVYSDDDGDGAVTAANGLYEGYACAADMKSNNKCNEKTVSVWNTHEIAFSSLSSSTGHIVLEYWDGSKWQPATSSLDVSSGAYFRVLAYVEGDNGELLALPSGATVKANKDSLTGGDIIRANA